MPSGFGIIDYIVVFLVVAATAKMLSKRPDHLLLWLPTFLTIDFFIPFGSQLTPSRLVPLMLGAAILLKNIRPRKKDVPLLVLVTALILVSLIAALLIGDAGVRPILRTFHYLGLVFLFVFVVHMLQSCQRIEWALWGLIIAGAVHSIYAAYQVIANTLGFPYRGIVYSESGIGGVAFAGDSLRVNGLADEPKRLAYVLFCAALAAIYFGLKARRSELHLFKKNFINPFTNQMTLMIVAGLCLIMSLLTYSGSYFLSVAILVMVLLSTFSWRAIGAALFSLVVLGFVVVALPSQYINFERSASNSLEQRFEEIESGLDANKVYRQEFYAHAFVQKYPISLLTGLGIGRYNVVLANEFGGEAGYSAIGTVAPLNSQIYEVGFDLGIVGLFIMYFGGLRLVIKVGRQSNSSYLVSSLLLFMLIQTFFVESKSYLIFVAAIASALVSQRILSPDIAALGEVTPKPGWSTRRWPGFGRLVPSRVAHITLDRRDNSQMSGSGQTLSAKAPDAQPAAVRVLRRGPVHAKRVRRPIFLERSFGS